MKIDHLLFLFFVVYAYIKCGRIVDCVSVENGVEKKMNIYTLDFKARPMGGHDL